MSTALPTPIDFAAHIERLRSLSKHGDATLRTLFTSASRVRIARSPGRLDIMGGIGDYSGSLVLELPIAEATFAAVQVASEPDVVIVSLNHDADAKPIVATIEARNWSALLAGDFESAAKYFAQDPASAWAAYIVGPVLVLLHATRTNFSGGLRILIDSRVPEGKGVASSAAVEVATMRAFAAALGIDVTGESLARLCQMAENLIVGAPCGIMDHMTSALGRESQLLALRCQPATIEGFVAVPKEISFWGIDSGVRHFVGGSDYSSVRCGAFMGYRIVAEAAGLLHKPASDRLYAVEIDDPHWHGYLANIAPNEFQTRFAALVPKYMSGSEFLRRYTGTTDHATRIDPARIYAVYAPTLHPIDENRRVTEFRAILQKPISESGLHAMGQLMYASHGSYTACGLGSDATDLLVQLVKEAGTAAGLYGAKITGGGSGGTVAILVSSGAENAVAAIGRRYTELTGRAAYIFRGSSPGAYSTPVQELVI